MRPIRPTPMTPTRTAGDRAIARSAVSESAVVSVMSVLPQRHDVFPAPALYGAQQRGLHAHEIDGLAEPGTEGPLLDDGAAELVVLDDDQVLVADPVGAARHETAVVGEAVPAQHGRVARTGIARRPVELQLVEPLEVPAGGSLRAVHVEGHLALRADDRPAGLERPTGAGGELAQDRRVVL